MYLDEQGVAGETVDNFKPLFKKFKSRKNQIDYSEIVDFHSFHQHLKAKTCDDEVQAASTINTQCEDEIYSSIQAVNIEENVRQITREECQEIGLRPVEEWGIYSNDRVPGLIFIADPFKDFHSKDYWIKQCLIEYPRKPNLSNLDVHGERKSDLWSDFVRDLDHGLKTNRTEYFKLRWVTLGYHYDWNTKLYYKERYSEFPSELSNLSKFLAKCLGYSYYNAEAGIVNYYHLDSTLAGHTDHSEYCMDSPLFSISFGCDAIFLIGGATKAVEPVPILLRSGDIVVMAGESRLAYHAVPKIIAPSGSGSTVKDETSSEELETTDSEWIREYMKQSRININIRQVLKEGQQFPD